MYETLLKTIERKGISRYRLAKMASITPQDLYATLGGKKEMFPSWRVHICEVLNMNDRELFPELPPIIGEVKPMGRKPKKTIMEQLEERVAMLEAKVEELERRIK